MGSPTLRARRATTWAGLSAGYASSWQGITPARLGAIAVVFAAADASDQLAGKSLLLGAPLDEVAHLLTALLVLWAVAGARYRRILTPALIASVAIDLDHIPARLGADWLTVGTPRPYTHSLLVVVVVLAGAWLWRARRELLIGIAAGLLIHFWRDMAEPRSGVALLWPITKQGFSLPHAGYLLVMAVVVAAGMGRSIGVSRVRRAGAADVNRPDPATWADLLG